MSMSEKMKKKKWDVFVYGDANIDIIIPRVEKLPKSGQEDEVSAMETFVGGGAALFTLGIGKLGFHPVFQGEIGDDIYGAMIREEFRNHNVDDCLLETSTDKKTGISLSFTNEKDRSFLTYRGTNDDLDIDVINLEHVRNSSHIHITGYYGSKSHDSYLNLLKRIKKETRTTISFDLGWDSTGEWSSDIYELFPYIDVLFMNETEATHYGRCDDAQKAALDFGRHCRIAVIKMGKKGAIAAKDGVICKVPGFQVNAVDTTGAGDSFNAGFVSGFLEKKSLQECITLGNACGALSVTALGGNSGFPDEEELMTYLSVNSIDETGGTRR